MGSFSIGIKFDNSNKAGSSEKQLKNKKAYIVMHNHNHLQAKACLYKLKSARAWAKAAFVFQGAKSQIHSC